ncbi:MAG TPA: class I SAM-dependent methyltransferase [Blastocatellia bacterium]|nr:class I SAM-dependent methyltransferase [Blastocatellia bacterium]
MRKGWFADKRRQRARRALKRQIEYQENKAQALRGHERDVILRMMQSAQRVREMLSDIRPIGAEARVLEVGSGAHGLIFYFGADNAVGIDPLAVSYAKLFPVWQGRTPTVAAVGEALPFSDQSFDVVLCDNVVDHAEAPAKIVAELARVLASGGLLYFTVNVHHPVYHFAAELNSLWNAAGVAYEIGPFADHTVHLTRNGARRLFAGLPLRILQERADIAAAKLQGKQIHARHAGDRLKRLFFKNALYEVIAVRE